jgi:hypothetical protein
MYRGYEEIAAYKIVVAKGLVPTRINSVAWSDWSLVLEGKAYYSPFKNIRAWATHYGHKLG